MTAATSDNEQKTQPPAALAAVIDASAAANLVLNDEVSKEVASALVQYGRLYAPAHFLAEVGQALRNIARRGECSPADAWARLAELEQQIVRVGIEPYLWQTWQWRDLETFQDMLYAAVAKDRQATLVTCDHHQAEAAVAVDVRVAHIQSQRSQAEGVGSHPSGRRRRL